MTTALFVAGLIISTVLAGGEVFPSPFGSAADALARERFSECGLPKHAADSRALCARY
jgi:hypothetical protein